MYLLAENPRTQRRAAIKRASKAGRGAMRTLDRQALGELAELYQGARDDLEAAIAEYAGRDATLRLEVMQDLLGQVRARLDALGKARDQALDEHLGEAADIGVRPFEGEAAILGRSLTQVADNALRFVRTFVAEDGLQLSDRLWRLDAGARQAVTRAIESAVIQGHSATRAAQDFLSRGEAVPGDIRDKMAAAQGPRVAVAAGRALMADEGNAYEHALRVFRTEINRAHGEAYRAAAQEHPDAIGTRFLLSPNHPAVDVCDMHASVNRYGLGPGVYPFGKSPWPAHPNTLSFEEVVFADEVSEDDKAGREDRIEWLKRQPSEAQASVLGSRAKQAALTQGVLVESEIATPWRVLREKYTRRGVEISGGVRAAGRDRPRPVGSTSRGVGPVIPSAVPADFKPAATLVAAGKVTRSLVSGAEAREYVRGADGEYLVRFRHGRSRRQDAAKVRREKYNNASLAKLEVDTANALNASLLETQQVAKALGIPALRGVTTAAGNAAASMGDGVLAVSKYNNRYFGPRMSREEAISNLEATITAKEKALARFQELHADNRAVIGSMQEQIGALRGKVTALREGADLHSTLNPPSAWTPAAGTTPPQLSDAFFPDPEDKFRSTVWHEFAHHIHQQLGVTDKASYYDPPLERTLSALYRERRDDQVFPTTYSRTNHKEWFAESYALYRLGRPDLLDSKLLQLIKDIEGGRYQP
ncbi:MAG: hypothetical protein AB7Q81_24290 [Gammaproteobacteria bacterium]